jgi:hypothetical protein
MGNPYRKMFNLFAISLLSFAIYLNFFRTESNQLPDRMTSAYGRSATSAQQKGLNPMEANKLPLAKVDRKN